MKLDKNSVQPVYLQLEQRLRQQIETGELNPGDRLPAETDLAAQYNISRMTVRRALEALVSEGLLVRQAGKGTFVANEKVSFAAPTLASFSHTMRGLGLSVTSTVMNLELVTAPPRVVNELHLGGTQSVVFLRRVRYINDEPMAIMSSYLPATFYDALRVADLSNRPITQVMEAAADLHLVTSQDTIEASLARPEEAELLDIRVGAPVLLGRGIVFESGGMPVRSSKVIYRGDRFRINFSASESGGAEIRLAQAESVVGSKWLALSFNLAE